jgi:hypothetical protein
MSTEEDEFFAWPAEIGCPSLDDECLALCRGADGSGNNCGEIYHGMNMSTLIKFCCVYITISAKLQLDLLQSLDLLGNLNFELVLLFFQAILTYDDTISTPRERCETLRS